MEAKTNFHILIVDDEPVFHKTIRHAFQDSFEFEGAISEDRMWEKLKDSSPYDLLLLDLRLEGTAENVGLKLIPKIRKDYPEVPIIVATIENDPDAVIAAMDAGANSYLYKGKYDKKKWRSKFQEVINAQKSQKLAVENQKLKREVERLAEQEEDEKYKFVGKSPKILEIKTLLEGMAEEANVTVLLTGETGVGKEVAARYLHKKGPRAHKPFVAVNLAAIPETMLENELFGHEKGAFSDAKTAQKGYFHQADGGIIMLDEIGHISSKVQDKLMRFLEDQTIYPLGSGKSIELDVQLIAATNVDIEKEVKNGRFRADLYQRLKMMVIKLPPLRHRKEDIPLILEHYMRLQNPNMSVLELMLPEVLEHLLDFQWPGNVRELRHTVDYMLLRKRIFKKEKIDLDCLPEDVRKGTPLTLPPEEVEPSAQQPEFKSKKEEDAYSDLVKIEAALRQTGANKGASASLLGFKGTDNMRSRIRTCAANYNGTMEQFPLIQKYYASILK